MIMSKIIQIEIFNWRDGVYTRGLDDNGNVWDLDEVNKKWKLIASSPTRTGESKPPKGYDGPEKKMTFSERLGSKSV